MLDMVEIKLKNGEVIQSYVQDGDYVACEHGAINLKDIEHVKELDHFDYYIQQNNANSLSMAKIISAFIGYVKESNQTDELLNYIEKEDSKFIITPTKDLEKYFNTIFPKK